ncbi:MAG: multiheme c-type cytochrome, partial [Thermodesulfobacteriota bacterium]
WKASPHGGTYELLKPGVRSDAKKKAAASIKEKLVKYGGRDQAYVDGLDVVNADFTEEPLCLRCHTTGFGQKGGFKPGKTAIDPDEPSLEQVGCEMCHSARGGSRFRAVMKIVKPVGSFSSATAEKYGKRYDNWTGNVCKRCHEHENTPFQPSIDPKYKFNFKERMKKVHEIQKFTNDDNKDQLIEGRKGHETKDPGATQEKGLVIEQWTIVGGKVKFKDGTLPVTYKKGEGYTLHYQDGSSVKMDDIKTEKQPWE